MIQAVADAMNERVEAIGRFVDSLPKAPTNRAVGLALAVPTGTVLGIARWLDPSPKGYGTHLQLGLGECTVMHFTGYPCPMCGMTTTFSLYAHLRFWDALVNQPFGFVLFWATFVGCIVGVLDLITGRGYWRKALAMIDRRESLVAGVLLVGMMGGWIYKIFMIHPELLPG